MIGLHDHHRAHITRVARTVEQQCPILIAVDPATGVARASRARKLTDITAVDPAAAGRASDEMLGSVGRLRDCRCIFRAGHWSQGPPVKREGYPLAGVFPVTGFTRWTWAQAGHRIEM
jgi:hypothetical protein